MFASGGQEKRRTIFDAEHNDTTPPKKDKLRRGENDPSTGDKDGDNAFEYSGIVYDFYKEVFERNSIDDNGMRLDSVVHFGQDYANAFWDGTEMVYGDGDGEFFKKNSLTEISITAHEMTHGVTEYEASLVYRDQSGALNEHISDAFGVMVDQFYHEKQSVDKADWLIGRGTLMHGQALRSMKAPGTAYDDEMFGKDPQPDRMDKFVKTNRDNGGVHINSGIPNKAFYLVCTEIGGHSWEGGGKIWYNTLLDRRLRADADFNEFANITFDVAGSIFGVDGREQKGVRKAWQDVGINIDVDINKRKPSRIAEA